MANEEEIRFAEEMHARAHRLMAVVAAGKQDKALMLAGELCTLAANRHNGLKMANEAGDVARFDLGALAGLPMAGPELRE